MLEPFLCKLKTDLVLCEIFLPGATTLAKYSAYTDDVSILVSSRARIDEVSKEIRGYETVTGAKINCDKSVGLWLGVWKGVSLLELYSLNNGLVKIFSVWFNPDIQLEMNWLEVQEKFRVSVCL